MAGIDTDIEGEARPQPGIKIGYLPQEPQLNLEHTVRESVEEALAEVVGALKRPDEVYALYAEEGADFDKLAAEQGRRKRSFRRTTVTTSTPNWNAPPMRCACRTGTPKSPTCPG